MDLVPSHFLQYKEQDKQVEFILIGAGIPYIRSAKGIVTFTPGLPRTGTHSTFTALEQILPGKCHHMLRAFTGERDASFWPKVGRGEFQEANWKEFINAEGLSASVDFPMSLYWRDLMKMYPNAKVLLTVRDPVKWYQSVRNTIRKGCAFMQESVFAAPLRMIGLLKRKPIGPALYTCTAPTYLGAKYPQGLFGAIDGGEETAVRFFNDWKEQVMAEVPADRLLVFEVKQGWEPLCKFLGVPQPETPFPHTNDTKSQEDRLQSMKKFCFFLWGVTAAAVGTGAYFLKDSVPIPKISFT